MFDEGTALYNIATLPAKRRAAVEAALKANPAANKSGLVAQQRSEWAGWRGWLSATTGDGDNLLGAAVALP